MSSATPLWFRSPLQLIKRPFLPSRSASDEENYNALSRLVMLATVLLVVTKRPMMMSIQMGLAGLLMTYTSYATCKCAPRVESHYRAFTPTKDHTPFPHGTHSVGHDIPCDHLEDTLPTLGCRSSGKERFETLTSEQVIAWGPPRSKRELRKNSTYAGLYSRPGAEPYDPEWNDMFKLVGPQRFTSLAETRGFGFDRIPIQ
jgi:hypothetical protein